MSNIDELVTPLQDPNPDIRSGVVEALAKTGDSKAVAPLITALQDKSESVRGCALQGLKDIGSPAVPLLIVALKNRNPWVRRKASCIIDNIGYELKEIGDFRKVILPVTFLFFSRRGKQLMKNLNQLNKYSTPISILLLIAFLSAGCAALEEAQQRKQERTRQQQQQRYVTFERPTTEIQMAADGLTLESEHYTFTFAEDLLTHPDYDEPEERQNVGKGALLFMESLYNYVHDIFGFEPNHQLKVNLRQTHHGSTHLATTSTRTQTIYQNGEWLKIVEGIEMDFPVTMFNQRDVRAHELTHAFTNIYLLPTWFAEGIAVLVQVEYARGTSFRRLDLHDDLKTDLDGRNAVQYWEGHLSRDQLTEWRYSYSYSIVAELKKRFGEDFYPTVFRLIEADQLHQRLPGEMTTSFLAYYLSQAAGQDLIPFFEELRFDVRRITREQIMAAIMQANQEQLGR